jgi:hypothetical protein
MTNIAVATREFNYVYSCWAGIEFMCDPPYVDTLDRVSLIYGTSHGYVEIYDTVVDLNKKSTDGLKCYARKRIGVNLSFKEVLKEIGYQLIESSSEIK